MSGQKIAYSVIWLLLILPVMVGAQTFEIEVVDSSAADVGTWTSLVIDNSGVPHVSYVDETNTDLRYASRQVSGWTSEIAGPFDFWNVHETSLALDVQGRPHIAFHGAAGVTHGAFYTSKPYGSWTAAWVYAHPTAAHALVGFYISLDLDLSGFAHVSFQNDFIVPGGGSPELWYANNIDGFPAVRDSIRPVGSYTSLKVNQAGQPRIVHQGLDMEYLEWNGSSWDVDIIATYPVNSRYMSLELDTGGEPHIAFYDAYTGDLKYARRSLGTWYIETVAAGGDIGLWSSLALDSQDNPHISFYSATSRRLYYSYAVGGVWTDIIVDASADVGQYSSIDLDVYGNVYISYYDADNGDLKFAAYQDCNENGVADSDDIALGTSQDCNGNGFPDECEIAYGTSTDCNLNSIPDECESLPDCNNNGIPDVCDLYFYHTSEDCNNNDIPDECESQDCNNNGIFDGCDIRDGTSTDCNRNGRPDECDLADGGADCNSNNVLDECDFGMHLVVNGESGGNYFGQSVASGDINGDGIYDLIVGAWGNSVAALHAGRVYVFYGGSPADTVPDLVLTGGEEEARLGFSVASGDVNNDGYDDIIAGAPGEYGLLFTGTRGRVGVYLGGTSPSTVPVHVFSAGWFEEDIRLGYSVAAADVNDDGFDDVVIGGPSSISNGTGYVYVYLGNNLDGTAHETWTDELGGDEFGTAVANVGDADGDGIDDVIVGAPGYPAGASRGRAYVYFGQAGAGMIAGPVFDGAPGGWWRLGAAVGTAGDVNNDGYADLIVGESNYNGAYFVAGRALLYLGGSVVDATPDWNIEGTSQNDKLGSAVAAAGDVNGDGVDDVLVGATGNQGSVQLYIGGAPLDTAVYRRFTGDSFNDKVGTSLVMMHDLNGDGYGEFAIGAPGYNGQRGRVWVSDILLPDFADVDGNGVPDTCEVVTGVENTIRTGPPGSRLLGAFPSPFNPITQIEFELSEPGDVLLEVFDATGHRVSTLARSRYPAGRFQLTWDSRSDSGDVASGIYFVRLYSNGYVSTIKIVLVK